MMCLTFLWQGQICFLVLHLGKCLLKEFMDFVEDFGAKVNKYSQVNENMNMLNLAMEV